MNKALVIGNGKSRETFKIEKVPFVKFGCNAIYRDLKVDWLIAMDDDMIDEIKKSDFPKKRFITPSEIDLFEPLEYSPFGAKNNAGVLAMKEAISRDFNKLFLVGMDFVIDDRNYNIDNVYENTNGYSLQTRATYGDTKNRLRYFEWFAQNNPDVEFRFLLPRNSWTLRSINSKNVNGQFFDDFYREFC